MGGAREDFIQPKAEPKKEATTTVAPELGSNQKIRYHESNGEIHFHVDDANLKAAIPVAEWFNMWRNAVNFKSSQYIDVNNQALLTLQPFKTGTNVDLIVNVEKINIGVTFDALNKFNKR